MSVASADQVVQDLFHPRMAFEKLALGGVVGWLANTEFLNHAHYLFARLGWAARIRETVTGLFGVVEGVDGGGLALDPVGAAEEGDFGVPQCAHVRPYGTGDRLCEDPPAGGVAGLTDEGLYGAGLGEGTEARGHFTVAAAGFGHFFDLSGPEVYLVDSGQGEDPHGPGELGGDTRHDGLANVGWGGQVRGSSRSLVRSIWYSSGGRTLFGGGGGWPQIIFLWWRC